MNTLTVTIIQSDILWENKAANLLAFEQRIFSIQQPTDLILLPEMFNTGFSMNAESLAEEDVGKTIRWMQQIAKEKNCAIAGTLIASENGKYFNRLYFITPAEMHRYDKRHLFLLSDEPEKFEKGKRRLIVTYRGWKICPLICYDLRFPVWSRNTENYDLLIYHANWPAKRKKAWDILLQARAIENQSFVIGVNRTGTDGNGIIYKGGSVIIDPVGNILASAKNNSEKMITFILSKKILIEQRKNFPVLKDRDDFKIKE